MGTSLGAFSRPRKISLNRNTKKRNCRNNQNIPKTIVSSLLIIVYLRMTFVEEKIFLSFFFIFSLFIFFCASLFSVKLLLFVLFCSILFHFNFS